MVSVVGKHLHLVPPIVEAGHFQDLVQAGETLSVSNSPRGNSVAVFLTSALSTLPSRKERGEDEVPLYFACTNNPPTSERRLFITDTILIFSALQSLLKTRVNGDPQWTRNNETISIVRKLAIDYVNFIKECWIHTTRHTSEDTPLQYSSDHYRSLYSCFSLFIVLFLPEPDYEDAPVGEELMEWLNIHFIEPSTEEGDQLSSLDRPWEDSNFWSYLTRATIRGLTKASTFFLRTLSQHESEHLRDLTRALIPLIDGQPRLSGFNSERDYAYASRRWKEKIQALRVEMNRVPETEREDAFENWWVRLSDVVGILEGRAEVLQRVCEELGSDWKEVCSAWGVFIDTRLRRQDLPDIVAEVLDLMPPDSTIMEDMVHSALFSAQLDQALSRAAELDLWLAAHLVDFMLVLSLIDSDVNTDSELTKRDQHILSYAEYAHSEPTLWRVTLAYMYSCGEIGKKRGDEVLLRVPLRLQEQKNNVSSMEADGLVGTLRDLNQICFEHEREGARRAVCRIAARTFVNEKNYGLAVSYCLSAEDWPGVGRIVDSVLDEYLHNDPETFSKFAADVSPSLRNIGSHDGVEAIFIQRLVFVVRYSQFHGLRIGGELREAASDLMLLLQEVAPKSWWAILLCDSVELLQYGPVLLFPLASATELLRKLEEIFTRTSQGAGEEYLSLLIKKFKGTGEQDALERLKTVRLALARYFARCAITGVQGTIASQ